MRAKLLIVPILFSVLVGCCPKVFTPTTIKDSVRVEIRDRIIHDTTTVTIPVEVEKIVTRDTVSHLQNTYAKSDAVVSGGFLFHSLESIPQIIRVPFDRVVTDTLWRESVTVESEKIVEIEKPLSWWQKFRMGAFWWLSGAVLLLLAWTFRKFL